MLALWCPRGRAKSGVQQVIPQTTATVSPSLMANPAHPPSPTPLPSTVPHGNRQSLVPISFDAWGSPDCPISLKGKKNTNILGNYFQKACGCCVMA